VEKEDGVKVFENKGRGAVIYKLKDKTHKLVIKDVYQLIGFFYTFEEAYDMYGRHFKLAP